MNLWQRYRVVLLCVVLGSIPFFFLRTTLRDPSRYDEFDRLMLPIVATLQDWIDRPVRGAAEIFSDYIYLVRVKQANDRLTAENARLRSEAARHQSEFAANNQLRRLLQLRVQTAGETYAAEVIASDTTPEFRVNRLAITSQDRTRLRAGLPVITPDGLVGQISRVFGGYADVLLSVDSRSAVDVRVERSGARGIVRGTGERDRYAARVEYLQRTDDVRVGDAVVTSGLGCRFPDGLLVGRVAAVTRREFGLYQEVEIAPAVNFSRLSEVLVLATESVDRPGCRPGAAPSTRARQAETRGGS